VRSFTLVKYVKRHAICNKKVVASIICTEGNGFAEVSKNLARYRSENNFVGFVKIIVERLRTFKTLMIMLQRILIDILATSLSVHNYFDGPTKLSSDLYLNF